MCPLNLLRLRPLSILLCMSTAPVCSTCLHATPRLTPLSLKCPALLPTIITARVRWSGISPIWVCFVNHAIPFRGQGSILPLVLLH